MMLEMSQVAWQLQGVGDAKDAAADWEYYIDAATAAGTTAVNLGTEAAQPNVVFPSFTAGPPDYWRVNAKRAALTTAFSQVGTGPATWMYLMMPLTLDTSGRRFWSTGAGDGTGADPGWGMFSRKLAGVPPTVGFQVEQTVASSGIYRYQVEVASPGANIIQCVACRQESGGGKIDIWVNNVLSNVNPSTAAGSRDAANASEFGGLHGLGTVNLDHRLYRAAMSKVYLSNEDVFATMLSWLDFVGVSL